jgi:hypothetical protein
MSEALHPEQDQAIDASTVYYPQRRLPRWNPFSAIEPVCFYNPLEHVDALHALKNAPIQSQSQDDEVKSFE